MTNTNNDYPEIEFVMLAQKPRPWWKRWGCLFGILAWLALMAIPFCLLLLAFQGDITIHHRGDVPSSFEHPFAQVVLIMEPREQGLRFTRSTVQRLSENEVCMQTYISFWMWEGEGQDSVSYCKCYARVDHAEGWGSGEQVNHERCLDDE